MGERDATAGDEFERGRLASMDPVNEAAIERGGSATTTLLSSWLHQKCPTCAHTFRPGDVVLVSLGGVVRHDLDSLPCARGIAEVTPSLSAEISSFFDGLEEAWPPALDLPMVRLSPGHPLLAQPMLGFRRHTCAVCGHTLRLYDAVVLCPCSPHRAGCRVAIHRDVVHGLHCLDAWQPAANGLRYCPITSRALDE